METGTKTVQGTQGLTATFNGNRNTLTKMSLKVTVVTFVTPQLEKIHRLTASLFFLQDPPPPFLRIPPTL